MVAYVGINTTRDGRKLLDDVGQRYSFFMNREPNGVTARVRREDAPTLIEILKENNQPAEYQPI